MTAIKTMCRAFFPGLLALAVLADGVNCYHEANLASDQRPRSGCVSKKSKGKHGSTKSGGFSPAPSASGKTQARNASPASNETPNAVPRMPRSVGAEANLFRGSKITRELAEALGIERRRLGNAVEKIKKAAGLRGNENVVINRASGDVFDAHNEGFIGNVFDELVK